ncbi:hypothetical protein PHYSODRAFT_463828, partial [Phytophthora sojae]
CRCSYECLPLQCWNAVSDVFCTDENCGSGADCANRVRTSSRIELIDTPKGLGDRTSDWLSSWEVVGEYTGVLTTSEDSIRESHYALMMGTPSADGQIVFVDAAACGGIIRHMNHSC